LSYGFGCRGSELGHLFYEDLGGEANQNLTTTHNANFNLFTNWQKIWGTGEANFYWTSTYYTGPSSYKAWGFAMVPGGSTTPVFIGEEQHVWAVRDGDVAAVPEATTYAMFLAGLGLVGWSVRKSRT
jgi:hypothetical protein